MAEFRCSACGRWISSPDPAGICRECCEAAGPHDGDPCQDCGYAQSTARGTAGEPVPAAPTACHPFDEPCDYGTGGPCRNHGGVVPEAEPSGQGTLIDWPEYLAERVVQIASAYTCKAHASYCTEGIRAAVLQAVAEEAQQKARLIEGDDRA